MEAVYVHIPFCNHICSYCDFPKMLRVEHFVDEYLEALKIEIENNYDGERISTLYIGGGSPSCLNKYERIKLFRILSIFNRTPDCEFTIELNPDDIDDQLIDDIVYGGVNRVSIGIQSFNLDNLKLLERYNDYKDIETKLNLLRKRGIDNINLDLMYALPNEKLSVLKKDLSLITKLEPTHISTYSLILEKNTKLYINGVEPINEDLDAKMYETIRSYMNKKGYIQYEVSNFSKPGYESRHNLNYWSNGEYYGFGLGASGFLAGFRYNNTRNFSEYLKGNFRYEQNLLTYKDQMDNEIMLGLRKIKGINVDDFYEKYGENIQNVYPVIKELIRNKELVYKDGYLAIPLDKTYVMNEILVKII